MCATFPFSKEIWDQASQDPTQMADLAHVSQSKLESVLITLFFRRN